MIGMCERFHSLPDAGGILDQEAGIIRLMKIVHMGHPEREGSEV